MIKKLLLEAKINFLKNIKGNFRSPFIWGMVLVTIGLYLIKYLLQYEFTTSTRDLIAYTDWALGPITFLIMMFFLNKKGLTTYGIYLAAAKILSILFWVIGSDVSSLTGGIQVKGTDFKHLFSAISNIMIVGTLVIEVLIIPVIITMAIGNLVNYSAISNLENPTQKTIWSTTFIIFEVVLFFSMFQFVIYPLFDSLSERIITHELNGVGTLGTFLKPMLAFVFFPLLFMINNFRRTNLFLGRNQQLYIGTQITFLIKYIVLQHSTDAVGLIFPALLIAFISIKITAFIVLLVLVEIHNHRGWSKKKFVPVIVGWKFEENKFFKHMDDKNRSVEANSTPKTT